MRPPGPSESSPLLRPASPSPRSWRRPPPSLWVLAPPLVLHTFANHLSKTPYDQLVLLLSCKLLLGAEPGGTLPEFARCREDANVQALTSSWMLVLDLSLSIPSLVMLPLIGFLSDRWGRKSIMISGMLGSLLNLLTIIAVGHFGLPMSSLAIAHVAEGLLGGKSAMGMTMMVYLTDVYKSSTRTEAFGYFQAATWAAITFAPVVGGWIIRMASDAVFPFYAAACLDVLVFSYILLVLPESKGWSSVGSDPSQHPGTETAAGSHDDSPRRASEPRTPLSVNISREGWILASVFFLVYMTSPYSLFYLYTAFKFGWDAFENGKFNMINGFSKIFYIGLMLPLALRFGGAGLRLGTSSEARLTTQDRLKRLSVELNLARIAVLIYGAGFIGFALAETSWVFYTVSILDGFGIVAAPILRSILSQVNSQSRQGSLFAQMEILIQLAILVSNVVFKPIYRETVSWMPNLWLFLMAAVLGLAWLVSLFVNVEELESQCRAHADLLATDETPDPEE
ncbi:major facilitator superfamily domain-containing protein [Polychytrium aggregatum]|uniref:major facilitator superfamily domain-containing protein n=1 Tax=Polychytrium aggregatum TaxID=110093 RepID=UPI0022FE17B2|nr:major facilitator superfamily domain-containing protein [Polychytrium aggregatum]KAI9206945.1 major facilitator superfamily domain-containing protein [Polychytrium aggregatum]